MEKMLKVFILLLASVVPYHDDNTFRNHVDLIELNTYHHDETGLPIFTQFIFWDWSDFHKNWVVVSWQMNRGTTLEPIWKASEEHKKLWMKAAVEYATIHNLSIADIENRYMGEWNPIPGVNYPEKRNGKWNIVLHVSDRRVHIQSDLFIETNTMNDPERDNHKILKADDRRGLNGINFMERSPYLESLSE